MIVLRHKSLIEVQTTKSRIPTLEQGMTDMEIAGAQKDQQIADNQSAITDDEIQIAEIKKKIGG